MFKSRWGYHPCSYETYRKLKVLKKRFWESVIAYGNYKRWIRKQEQNRVGPEPRYCDFFLCAHYQRHKPVGAGVWQILFGGTFIEFVQETLEKARMGSATEVEPLPALTVQKIDDAYEKVEAWFAQA
jgi:hypothetical protein